MQNTLLTAKDYFRKISFNERIYLSANKIKSNFNIQLVFEGKKITELKEQIDELNFGNQLRAAVVKVAHCNPGVRLVARGNSGWMRWLPEGPLPTIRNIGEWQDCHMLSTELNSPLCPYKGPTCEIVYSLKPEPKLIFRCFHGVMDASGLLYFAEEIFRVLKNESPLGTNSTLNDTQFVKWKVGSIRRRRLNADCPPIGQPIERINLVKPRELNYQKISINGAKIGIVAQIAAAITAFANKQKSIKTRIMIPVDIRNYDKTIRSTANLSYPLFIETSTNQSWQELHKLILKKLIDKEPLQVDRIENIATWFPLRLLRGIVGLWTRWQKIKKRFLFSALISHVSFNDSKLFKFENYEFHSFYFLPQLSEFIPLSIATTSMGNNIELMVSASNDFMDQHELSKIINTIKTTLSET